VCAPVRERRDALLEPASIPRVIASRSLKAVRKGFSKRSSHPGGAVRGRGRIVRRDRNQHWKLSGAGEVAVVGEGRVVGRDHLRRELGGAAALHDPARVEAGRLLRVLAPGQEGGARRRVADRQERVRRHHAREPVRVLGQQPQPQQPAPVLTHERDVPQRDGFHETAQPTDVSLVAVVLAAGRLVGAPEAHQVGRHAQPGGDQDRHQLA
jgi:hypothetical protein